MLEEDEKAFEWLNSAGTHPRLYATAAMAEQQQHQQVSVGVGVLGPPTGVGTYDGRTFYATMRDGSCMQQNIYPVVDNQNYIPVHSGIIPTPVIGGYGTDSHKVSYLSRCWPWFVCTGVKLMIISLADDSMT